MGDVVADEGVLVTVNVRDLLISRFFQIREIKGTAKIKGFYSICLYKMFFNLWTILSEMNGSYLILSYLIYS